MAKVIDLVGQRFGRLVVVEEAGRNKFRSCKWKCQCDCGNECEVAAFNLRTNHTTSCGCVQKEWIGGVNRTHGASKSREYEIWQSMRKRCYNTRSKAYLNYGGRGITVCERWNTFEQFYADMGSCPDGFTIERVDNDGNYEPKNCIWADRFTQAKNKRIQRSNTSGYVGVRRYPYNGRDKWVACITRNRVIHHLGYFDRLEDAVAARKAAEYRLDKRPLGENSNSVRQSA